MNWRYRVLVLLLLAAAACTRSVVLVPPDGALLVQDAFVPDAKRFFDAAVHHDAAVEDAGGVAHDAALAD